MKNLVVAEKPSLMRTIIHALETQGERFASEDGGEYFVSEHYIATAQFGHLMELKMPEEYPGRENLGSWKVENLPFFPKKYEYNIRSDAKKRFGTIRKLVKDPSVGTIYHCGDPDREGQILVDLVLRECGNTKPVLRPQLKALTDGAIVKAFAEARPNSEYKLVFNEGMTRMCFDWDYGINLSQYATVKTGARPALNIGRVIGAIVTEIYNRDRSIEAFVPEEYFKVVSDVEDGFKLTSKERFEKTERSKAEDYAMQLQAGRTVVSDVQKKAVTKKPPKLFSQTSLQAAMSKRFGYSPEQTLELAQSLYQHGLTSYPRTNTEYIAEAEKDAVRDVIEKINRDGYLEFKDSKSIFDDSKIDGHSAITVTGKRPSSVSLSEDEKTCYKVILYRFMAVFCKEPCIYNKTTVVLDNPLEQFKVSGEVLAQEGWQRFEPKKKKGNNAEDDAESEQTLPNVSVGDVIETDFKAVSAETKPPKHHTVESLGKWMENPFRKEEKSDDEDAEDYKNILAGLEIGTSATRAGTLEKAVNKGYISLKKKAYHIEPRGRFLVEASQALGIDFSAKMTADMGRALKSVGRGKIGIMEVLNANRREVSRIISDDKEVKQDSAIYGGYDTDYVPKEKTDAAIYEPTGEEVTFSREWGGHRFTDDEIKQLLAGDEISFEAISSKGNKYTATGTLQPQKFKRKGEKKWHEFWGFCLNEREFPDEFLGHVFSEEEKEILLRKCKKEDRTIIVEDLKGKSGKMFRAKLVWNKKESKIEMSFIRGGRKK